MSVQKFFGEGVDVVDLFPDSPHRILVACSGGMDSVFLLHALWGCREKLGLELEVLTCDHGLRTESGEDAEWVRHLAWTLGVPCHVERFKIQEARKAGESMEMCARRLRREAFVRVAKRVGADTVALGHHMDDQAETVLMRLCRGTGTGGAAGMAWIREEQGVRFVRPLLGLRREAIRARVLAWGRSWREDGTNLDREMTRNRVRHDVLPVLCRDVNARAVEHFSAFAEQLRGLESWAAEETEKGLAVCFQNGALTLAVWRVAHRVLQERMVFTALERWGADPLKMSQEAVLSLAEAWRLPQSETKRYEVAGLRLLCSGGQITLEEQMPQIRTSMKLSCGEQVLWTPLQRLLSCEAMDEISREKSSMRDWRGELTAFCRAGDFKVRVPQRGDRYQPMGLAGTAKVSDLLGGAKVPVPMRKVWPVVTCGEEIVWVPGFRVAENWKAGVGVGLRLRLLR